MPAVWLSPLQRDRPASTSGRPAAKSKSLPGPAQSRPPPKGESLQRLPQPRSLIIRRKAKAKAKAKAMIRSRRSKAKSGNVDFIEGAEVEAEDDPHKIRTSSTNLPQPAKPLQKFLRAMIPGVARPCVTVALIHVGHKQQ